MPPKFKLSLEQEKEVVNLYNKGMSIRKIADFYPIGRTSVGYILKRHNVKTKSTGNSYKLCKYQLEGDYFKNINTKDKAYWLGFISADGHVSDDGVIIALSIRDEEHLKKFLLSVGSNAPLKYCDKTKSVKASIYSKDMVKDLRDLGFFRNKSETQTFPNIPKNLYSHFIRGIFDGDGSLSQDGIQFCGTKSMVGSIKRILDENLNIKNSPIIEVGNTLNIINWFKNRHLILDYIYKDSSVHLDRKYEKYLIFKERFKNSKRLKEHII